jgi:hypothetical protein
VRAAGEKMGAEGLTAQVHVVMVTQSVVEGARRTRAFDFSGAFEAPGKIRFSGTVSMPDAPPTEVEMLSVDDGATTYVRAKGGAWQKVPDESPSDIDPKADYQRLLAAATDVKMTGTEAVDGVECYVVFVDINLAELEAAEPGKSLSESLTSELGLTPDEITAALNNANGTRRLWIGVDDGLVYRDQQDTVVEAGAKGTYGEHGVMTYSSFGEPIDPPITAPSDV